MVLRNLSTWLICLKSSEGCETSFIFIFHTNCSKKCQFHHNRMCIVASLGNVSSHPLVKTLDMLISFNYYLSYVPINRAYKSKYNACMQCIFIPSQSCCTAVVHNNSKNMHNIYWRTQVLLRLRLQYDQNMSPQMPPTIEWEMWNNE